LIIGTTSYVLPDDYIPNLRLLAPLVDDVELMFFEGANLPAEGDFRRMTDLCRRDGFGVTVHLPVDADLSHPRPGERQRALEVCLRAIELTLPLAPRAYVVHPAAPTAYPKNLEAFGSRRQALAESLGALAEVTGPSRLAVENLEFPFAWVWPVVEELGLSTVLDVGHLELAGGNPEEYLERYSSRLAVVHLHGVAGGRDHQDPAAWGRPRLRRQMELFRAVEVNPLGEPLVITLEVFGGRPTVAALRSTAEALSGLAKGAADQAERLLSAAKTIEQTLATR